MRTITQSDILSTLLSGGKVTLDFDVKERESALDLIKRLAKDLGRTYEEQVMENGQSWFQIVTHSTDNYEVNVWVEPEEEVVDAAAIEQKIIQTMKDLKTDQFERWDELNKLLHWIQKKNINVPRGT